MGQSHIYVYVYVNLAHRRRTAYIISSDVTSTTPTAAVAVSIDSPGHRRRCLDAHPFQGGQHLCSVDADSDHHEVQAHRALPFAVAFERKPTPPAHVENRPNIRSSPRMQYNTLRRVSWECQRRAPDEKESGKNIPQTLHLECSFRYLRP